MKKIAKEVVVPPENAFMERLEIISGDILFWSGVVGILIFVGFLVLEAIRILPRIPAKLESDASIGAYARTITEAQVKQANLAASQLEEFKTLNAKVLELERDVYKAKLDIEYLNRRRFRHPLPSTSILHEER